MSQKSIILVTVLFALLVLGMFIYANLKQTELQKTNLVEEPVTTAVVDTDYLYITQVDAKHFFADGAHTLVGEISMPTPCDLLESESVVMESYPEQVTINFSALNNSDDCVQVITPQRFRVDIQASKIAQFSATFADRPIKLNLIPAGEGESPDDFELFIKG